MVAKVFAWIVYQAPIELARKITNNQNPTIKIHEIEPMPNTALFA